ncbi:hypothetical protein LCGC14_2769560, partial [marine sediment metagenome]
MKENELRKYATCAGCNKKLGETIKGRLPMFATITFNRYAINPGAMRRQAGMEMMLGDVAIAQVMGLHEDMAEKITG